MIHCLFQQQLQEYVGRATQATTRSANV